MIEDRDLKIISEVFRALGSPVRLKILYVLKETKRPVHIKALSRILKIDYAATYRHVKTLEKTGLIKTYEVGRSRVLALSNGKTKKIMELLALI